jgi:uncharacterized membrane protein
MHTIAPVALAIFLAAAGVAHFAVPDYFRGLVPTWLPRAGALVAVSGVAEIVAAGLIVYPASRAIGGWLAVGMISTYLTVWIDALRHTPRDRSRYLDGPFVVIASLVVNLGYLVWALTVALT